MTCLIPNDWPVEIKNEEPDTDNEAEYIYDRSKYDIVTENKDARLNIFVCFLVNTIIQILMSFVDIAVQDEDLMDALDINTTDANTANNLFKSMTDVYAPLALFLMSMTSYSVTVAVGSLLICIAFANISFFYNGPEGTISWYWQIWLCGPAAVGVSCLKLGAMIPVLEYYKDDRMRALVITRVGTVLGAAATIGIMFAENLSWQTLLRINAGVCIPCFGIAFILKDIVIEEKKDKDENDRKETEVQDKDENDRKKKEEVDEDKNDRKKKEEDEDKNDKRINEEIDEDENGRRKKEKVDEDKNDRKKKEVVYEDKNDRREKEEENKDENDRREKEEEDEDNIKTICCNFLKSTFSIPILQDKGFWITVVLFFFTSFGTSLPKFSLPSISSEMQEQLAPPVDSFYEVLSANIGKFIGLILAYVLKSLACVKRYRKRRHNMGFVFSIITLSGYIMAILSIITSDDYIYYIIYILVLTIFEVLTENFRDDSMPTAFGRLTIRLTQGFLHLSMGLAGVSAAGFQNGYDKANVNENWKFNFRLGGGFFLMSGSISAIILIFDCISKRKSSVTNQTEPSESPTERQTNCILCCLCFEGNNETCSNNENRFTDSSPLKRCTSFACTCFRRDRKSCCTGFSLLKWCTLFACKCFRIRRKSFACTCFQKKSEPTNTNTAVSDISCCKGCTSFCFQKKQPEQESENNIEGDNVCNSCCKGFPPSCERTISQNQTDTDTTHWFSLSCCQRKQAIIQAQPQTGEIEVKESIDRCKGFPLSCFQRKHSRQPIPHTDEPHIDKNCCKGCLPSCFHKKRTKQNDLNDYDVKDIDAKGNNKHSEPLCKGLGFANLLHLPKLHCLPANKSKSELTLPEESTSVGDSIDANSEISFDKKGPACKGLTLTNCLMFPAMHCLSSNDTNLSADTNTPQTTIQTNSNSKDKTSHYKITPTCFKFPSIQCLPKKKSVLEKDNSDSETDHCETNVEQTDLEFEETMPENKGVTIPSCFKFPNIQCLPKKKTVLEKDMSDSETDPYEANVTQPDLEYEETTPENTAVKTAMSEIDLNNMEAGMNIEPNKHSSRRFISCLQFPKFPKLHCISSNKSLSDLENENAKKGSKPNIGKTSSQSELTLSEENTSVGGSIDSNSEISFDKKGPACKGLALTNCLMFPAMHCLSSNDMTLKNLSADTNTPRATSQTNSNSKEFEQDKTSRDKITPTCFKFPSIQCLPKKKTVLEKDMSDSETDPYEANVTQPDLEYEETTPENTAVKTAMSEIDLNNMEAGMNIEPNKHSSRRFISCLQFPKFPKLHCISSNKSLSDLENENAKKGSKPNIGKTSSQSELTLSEENTSVGGSIDSNSEISFDKKGPACKGLALTNCLMFPAMHCLSSNDMTLKNLSADTNTPRATSQTNSNSKEFEQDKTSRDKITPTCFKFPSIQCLPKKKTVLEKDMSDSETDPYEANVTQPDLEYEETTPENTAVKTAMSEIDLNNMEAGMNIEPNIHSSRRFLSCLQFPKFPKIHFISSNKSLSDLENENAKKGSKPNIGKTSSQSSLEENDLKVTNHTVDTDIIRCRCCFPPLLSTNGNKVSPKPTLSNYSLTSLNFDNSRTSSSENVTITQKIPNNEEEEEQDKKSQNSRSDDGRDSINESSESSSSEPNSEDLERLQTKSDKDKENNEEEKQDGKSQNSEYDDGPGSIDETSESSSSERNSEKEIKMKDNDSSIFTPDKSLSVYESDNDNDDDKRGQSGTENLQLRVKNKLGNEDNVEKEIPMECPRLEIARAPPTKPTYRKRRLKYEADRKSNVQKENKSGERPKEESDSKDSQSRKTVNGNSILRGGKIRNRDDQTKKKSEVGKTRKRKYSYDDSDSEESDSMIPCPRLEKALAPPTEPIYRQKRLKYEANRVKESQ